MVKHAEVRVAFTEASGHVKDAGFCRVAGFEFAVHEPGQDHGVADGQYGLRVHPMAKFPLVVGEDMPSDGWAFFDGDLLRDSRDMSGVWWGVY